MSTAVRAAPGESRAAYAFLAPSMLLLTTVVLVPLAWAMLISLQRTDGFGDGVFVGLENYRRLLGDGRFWRAAANTTLFTAIVTPASMVLGLGAALLLNTVLPARAFFRSVLILPMAVSGVATALTGLLVFDENTGVLNALLGSLGLPSVDWQSGGAAAFASVVLVTLWWRVGFSMLIYLTGLQAIDPGLHESAMLDGAGWWQRLRHVTVPLLGPSTFFLLIINVIFSFQVFDIVFVLTGGGPQDATSVLVTYAYETGFTQRDQGYGAALAWCCWWRRSRSPACSGSPVADGTRRDERPARTWPEVRAGAGRRRRDPVPAVLDDGGGAVEPARPARR